MIKQILTNSASRIVTGFTLLVLAVFGVLTATTKTAVVEAASAGDVIINEIMYNPVTGNQNDEFLELYNTTGAPIDLTDWQLYGDNGTINPNDLMITFGAITIDPGEYIVISPNSANTLATYGVTAAATYNSNLSNGGESLGLYDKDDNLISSVEYDDASPWPLTPDGTGPSLELKAINLDTTLAANWGASNDTLPGGATPGTAGEQNSLVGLVLPEITNVPDPNDVAASADVDITADVTGNVLSAVNLKYIVNFDTEVTVAMVDDGTGADAVAGDDTYTATIPGQAIKTLVRFRVEATDSIGQSSSPGLNNSFNYHGYYVKDPGLTSAAEIIQWFIEDDEYTDMYEDANNLITDQHPAVIVYGNDVYDNSSVRVKGSNTLFAPKKSLKVDLPAGYEIDFPDIGHNIKEFHLNANYFSQNAAKVPTVYWAMKQAGLSSADIQMTQIHRNGEFEGAYMLVDKYQSPWREAYNYDNGPMYEDYWALEAGSDTTGITLSGWKDRMILDRKDATKRGFILDDNNIPALMNYMAMVAVLQHHDYNRTQNIIYYKDNGTQRWEVLPWDHDGDLLVQTHRSMMNPYDMPGANGADSRFFVEAIYDEPDLRQAYYRRLSTLMDQFYSNDGLLDKYNELTTTYAALSSLDTAKWDGIDRRDVATDLQAIERFSVLFNNYLRDAWQIPQSQTQGERESVTIAEISADADNTNEYIRLDTSADTPVDISGWVIDEIDYTIPQGTVIPVGGSVYLLRDDVGYKASHAAVLVGGQFTTDLGGSGTLTLKTDTDDTIDSEAY